MKLHPLLKTLDTLAPLHLAESWDNVGLLVGDPDQAVARILLTIDLTPAVFAEAVQKKIDLILAYHPPIFEPLKKIVVGQTPNPCLYHAIRRGIAIYAFHTALDVVPGGVNDMLAQLVGLTETLPLDEKSPAPGSSYKLVVFVPEANLAALAAALFAQGAGKISPSSNYDQCSFRAPGIGTFACGPASHPAIGKPGSREEVREFRLEMVVPAARLSAVINALHAAHPYEEPAYDIFAMTQVPAGIGLGRFGDLPRPVSVKFLLSSMKRKLKRDTLAVIGPINRRVRRLAVAAGSCGSLLRQVIAHHCDFYLTGELKHHHALELQNAGITTVCLGHSHSERPILNSLARRLRQKHPALKISVSTRDRDPFTFFS